MPLIKFNISLIKKTILRLLPVFFILLTVTLQAQDINAHSPQPAQGSSQQRAAEKKKLAQQKKIAKGNEEGKKRHLKLQAKNTKKMMRESKRKAKLRNENKREFFLKRWFTKSHH